MTGKLGFGAEFWIGSPLVQVANVNSVNRPNLTVGTVDVTTHGSTNGIREFIAELADPGELAININYIPNSTGDTTLLAAVAARAATPFKLVLPAATGQVSVSGTCIPTTYEPSDIVIDDKMTASFTGKVSGGTTQAAV